jgi:hypothetical protein
VGEQVQLDMQMITKQSDLKHEVDILTNRLKERDRATMQEREQEILVIKMQAQMPIFVQEKEKTQPISCRVVDKEEEGWFGGHKERH